MTSKEPNNNEPLQTVTGYLHSVSPVKMSQKNHRYFNAVIQIDRHQYHNTVIFSPEKHNQLTLAARNKTPVKINNVRRKISQTDDKTYDVIINRESTIDVTDVSFPHKPPQESTGLTIAQIKTMPPNQKISALPAAVYSIPPTTNTINIRGTDWEFKTCHIADTTSSIELTLWDNHIESVINNESYTFTNLSTRKYNANLSLTTTRQSTITPLKTPILPTTQNRIIPHTVLLNNLTSPVEGAAIHIMKLCPKCQTPQNNLSPKDPYHRCQTCKILRKGSSYLTKCNGTLTFMLGKEEIALSITNSLLATFIQAECNIDLMDAQEIEEFLLTTGPLSVQYTSEKQITSLSKLNETEQQQKPHEQINSDEELCAAASQNFVVSTPSTPQRSQKQQITSECSALHDLHEPSDPTDVPLPVPKLTKKQDIPQKPQKRQKTSNCPAPEKLQKPTTVPPTVPIYKSQTSNTPPSTPKHNKPAENPTKEKTEKTDISDNPEDFDDISGLFL